MNDTFDTKRVTFTCLGALAFLLLFVFVNIPLNALNTSIQPAYAISGFAAAAYGPLSGFLIAFIGHTLNDFINYSSPWWSWIAASAVSGIIAGFSHRYIGGHLIKGEFGMKQAVPYLVWTLIAHLLAWVVCAPVLDILLYGEAPAEVFYQGFIAFLVDFPTALIGGLILLKIYALMHKKKENA